VRKEMVLVRKLAYYVIAGIAMLCVGIGRSLVEASPSVFYDFMRGLPKSKGLLETVLFGLVGLFLALLLAAAVMLFGIALYGAGKATEWGSRRILPKPVEASET